MGKQTGKKKEREGTGKSIEANGKQSKPAENSPKAYDKDTAVFISMAREWKDEGNRLFQRRDYEGAMLKYEKAINLLPRNHIDVSSVRSNMAECYMQMGLTEYPRAIHECNLALEVTPKYSKALLKRARSYEALNRLDLALRDVNTVLEMEPNNLMASEIAERVKTAIEKKGSNGRDRVIDLVPVPKYLEPSPASPPNKAVKKKQRKKKGHNVQEKQARDRTEEIKPEDKVEGIKTDDKVEKMKIKDIVEEKKDKDKFEETKTDNKVEIKKADQKSKENNCEDKIDGIKTNNKVERKRTEDKVEEKKAEDKLVVDEKISNATDEGPKRSIKLVLGEDIRWAQVPVNCSLLKLREVINDKFPSARAILVKYRDHEGDLVTITTTEELRWAEAAAEQHGSIRLYILEVSPDQDPFFEKVKGEQKIKKLDTEERGITANGYVEEDIKTQRVISCMEDWIIEFAQLFKNYVGFNSDTYLDLHEMGMKLYTEAMEETVSSEEAQDLFDEAADKFQEMAALALFNWGNVHMSKARKRVYVTENPSRDSILTQVQSAYDWAHKEYLEAGKRYEEALRIKPDFYEGILALGQQQFEQAKLTWYHAIGDKVDLETWDSDEVLHLYNNAEENMERGMQMWEVVEEKRLKEVCKPSKLKSMLQKMGLDEFIQDLPADEAEEQASNMRSQIYQLWGTLLYERSIMEFKIGLPVWHECLEVAVEKFELAGASPTDIAVMIKNHCSNDNTLEGLGFNIDEIVQAWNEMHAAKRWQTGIPCFRLEPLLRRRVSKLFHALEHT